MHRSFRVLLIHGLSNESLHVWFDLFVAVPEREFRCVWCIYILTIASEGERGTHDLIVLNAGTGFVRAITPGSQRSDPWLSLVDRMIWSREKDRVAWA